MPKYDVEVTVNFMYEVEADSIIEAEMQGWNWEDYPMFSEVYNISVDEQYIPLDEEDDDDA
jgi:CRISPR/Cas system-associated exonuclease Cas4 (RecB family)